MLICILSYNYRKISYVYYINVNADIAPTNVPLLFGGFNNNESNRFSGRGLGVGHYPQVHGRLPMVRCDMISIYKFVQTTNNERGIL